MEFACFHDGEVSCSFATIDVDAPPTDEEIRRAWDEQNLRPRAIDGRDSASSLEAMAHIITCVDSPELVGRHFSWCLP